MNEPSNLWEAYAPWRAKLEGKPVPLHPDKAEPGFYWRRFVRGGPRVAVAVWIEQEIDEETGKLLKPERLVALCNGKLTRADSHWNYCAENAITYEAYLDAMNNAGIVSGPADPVATTAAPKIEKPIDPLSVPPIF